MTPLPWRDLPKSGMFFEAVCSKQSKGIEETK